MKSILLLPCVLFVALLLVPDYTYAQTAAGLVTCDGSVVPCDFCAFVKMVEGVITFLFGLLTLLAVMMIVFAGFKLVTSQGNTSAWGEAKNMLVNIIVGFVIIMAAWLIVDTLVKMLANPEVIPLGMWNTLSC